uniref:hypothetical protein n=1 Tax=Roseateles sp. TaxID=1971397 RepID=UPI00403636B0
MAEVVGDEPTPGGVMALITALGTDMAQIDASLVAVGRPCREASLRDANRRQLCEQVVRRMPGMLNEALDASALHMLERRLGLPQSPEALSQEEVSRALTALAEDRVRLLAEPSCANISRMGRQTVALGREGELAWVRAYLKQAGLASAPPR